MRKLIHPTFELDISYFKITEIEDNSWFSDTYFSKFSFPFEIDITKEIDVLTGFISRYRSNPETFFRVKYVHDNVIEDAIFEIEQHQTRLQCVLRFGLEEFPSFSKKLSELPLTNVTFPESIYTHAQAKVSQTWPGTTYNFPAIHTDRYSNDDAGFEFFQKVINNRNASGFLQNEFSVAEEAHYNRNIIQPLPYLFHVVQKIFEADGYTLAGEFLQDSILKKALLYNSKNYTLNNTASIQGDVNFMRSDYNSMDSSGSSANPRYRWLYSRTVNLTQPGFYKITGVFVCNRYDIPWNYLKIYNGNTEIWYRFASGFYYDGSKDFWDIEIDITVTSPVVITFECSQYTINLDDWMVVDATVSLISVSDSSNNLLPSLFFENAVDLRKSVPDITAKDLLLLIKNWFNYDINRIEDKTVYLDLINNQVNIDNPVDLSGTEVRFTRRIFQTSISFLLKFQDPSVATYTFLPVFHNKDGFVSQGFTQNDETNLIEINGLPLPLKTVSGLQTSHDFELTEDKAYLVLYDGLVLGRNVCQSPEPLFIPQVHNRYWLKWFNFRINAIQFVWVFKSAKTFIRELTTKRKIYAYGRYFIPRQINKTQYKRDQFEVEITGETI